MFEKKKYNVVFLIRREKKLGFKDVDHLLPFLYFLNRNEDYEFKAKGFIFDKKSNFYKNNDPRVKLLSTLKNVELRFLYKENFLDKILKFFIPKNNLNSSNIFNRVITKVVYKLSKLKKTSIEWKKELGSEFVNSETPIIFTLHQDHITLGIVSDIKKENMRAKCIVLPHGTVICENKMVSENDLEKNDTIKNDSGYDKIDFLLRTSHKDLDNATSIGFNKNKGFVIGSPRYCKEWLELKCKLKLDGKEVSLNIKNKIKILFLIPKKQINIFTEELVRTIDFLSSYNEFDIILLNNNLYYPKLSKYILNRSNIRSYLISEEYSTSKLIDWSEIVFHAGTGIIFESFLKDKITVFPRYLTCNSLISEKYKAGINLKNRDDLRSFCNSAVFSINNLRKKYKENCEIANKKFINDFVNANTVSVPQNINSSISSILNNFKIYKS